MRESIVLIGMAGAGKSTIGSILARALKYDFIDLDEYIREKEHRTIQQIIDAAGEEALLQLERRGLYEIDLQHRVVAPGGSIIYSPELIIYLKQHAVLVYLDETYEKIEKRLKDAWHRGIVGLKEKTLREIYEERRPLYARYADITVVPGGRAQKKVAEDILNRYLELR